MEQDLITSSSNGTQSTTQDPQSNTSSSSLTASSHTLQSGVVNLFTSKSGISLTSTALPSVGLKTSTTTQSNTPAVSVRQHHVSGVLIGLIAVVFIAAAITFWQATVAAKNTTE